MRHFFSFVYQKLFKNRAIVLSLVTLVTLISLYAGQRLDLIESITAMLPSEDPYVADQLLIYGNFDYNNRLFLEVTFADGSSGSLDDLVAASDTLYEKFSESGLFSSITYKADEAFLAKGFSFLSSHYPVLYGADQREKLPQLLSSASINEQLAANRRFLMETPGQLPRQMIVQDPLNLRQLYWPLLAGLNNGMANQLHDGAVVSPDGRAIMLVVQTPDPATSFSKTVLVLEEVDKILASFYKTYNGRFTVNYTGAHPAVRDNHMLIRHDVSLTVTISLIAITLLVFLAYRRIYLVFYSYLPVLFGGAAGVAIFSLFSNEIQGVVIGFSACLIGISVDYAIHILYRYDRAEDGASTVKILAPLALPIVLGAITTIGAFVCLHASALPGQRQLGSIAAIGIFSAMFFSLFILPLLLPATAKAKGRPLLPLDGLMERFFGWYDNHRPVMALLVLVLWVVALTGLPKTKIDGDMRHLNGLSRESARQEAIISQRWGQELLSEMLLVAVGDSPDEVAEQQYALLPFLKAQKTAGTIISFSSAAQLLLPESVQKENRQAFAVAVENAVADGLTDNIAAAAAAAGFKGGLLEEYTANLLAAANSPLIKYDEFLSEMGAVAGTYYSKNSQGQYLGLVRISVSPDQAAALAAAIRSVFPKIHWYHGQLYTDHLSDLVTSSMLNFGLLSLAVVCLIVFLTMGRLELLLLVVYALGSAMVWTMGLLGHLNIPINLMSSLFVVFVFGMSVDYVIFVINEMMLTRQGCHGDRGGTSGAIILSALTTVAALGSLALATHPAMNSVGFTAAIGMTSGMVAALIAIPLILRPLSQSNNGRPLGTFTHLINTVFGYGVFIIGAILGTLCYPLASLIFYGRPAGLERLINKYLQIICRMTLAVMPFGKIVIRGRENYVPANGTRIFICNHESMMDILMAEAYLPDIRMVVKNWVWKTPCMGFLVKKAGFLLVGDEDGDIIEKTRQILLNGHNLLVFPEGSRQIKRTFGRFHRGAYEMALKTGTPVQEVLLGGTSSAIRKGSIIVNRFVMVLEILPLRNLAGDSHALAKESGLLLAQAYDQCRQRIVSDPAFVKELLGYYNYTGPYIENYCYWKMRLDPIFSGIDALLPRTGLILDLGCGYGLMGNILAYSSPQRKIWSLDYDESKLNVARSCSMFPKVSDYVCESIFNADLPVGASGALLIDVLHYWPRDSQLEMLRKISVSLAPGGILVMRDGCQGATGQGKISFFEKLATFIGHNKTSHGLNFLSEDAYRELLQSVGFTVTRVITDLGRGSNYTFVCQKLGGDNE